MENETSLMNKKVDDITVGDAIKINVGVLAIMAGGAVAIGVAVTAKEKIQTRLAMRKLDKLEAEKTPVE